MQYGDVITHLVPSATLFEEDYRDASFALEKWNYTGRCVACLISSNHLTADSTRNLSRHNYNPAGNRREECESFSLRAAVAVLVDQFGRRTLPVTPPPGPGSSAGTCCFYASRATVAMKQDVCFCRVAARDGGQIGGRNRDWFTHKNPQGHSERRKR